MTTTPARLSVVIPTHDRLDLLKRSLGVLLDDEGCAEVVVVADGCSDGTDHYLETFARREPRIRPVLLHPGGGAAAARRAGFSAASCDVVLCLDDDVLPSAGLASGHARAHLGGGRKVVLGYMPTRAPVPLRAEVYATREYIEVYESLVSAFEAAPEKILANFWSGNFSVRRDDYLGVTEGHEDLVEYHEDRELGLRWQRSGVAATFVRSLRGDHDHARSWHTYLREGGAQGRASAQLSLRYPGSVVCEPWVTAPQTNPAVRVAMRIAQLPGTAGVMTPCLRAGTALAGRAGRFDLEKKLAHVAKDIAWCRAAASTLRAAG